MTDCNLGFHTQRNPFFPCSFFITATGVGVGVTKRGAKPQALVLHPKALGAQIRTHQDELNLTRQPPVNIAGAQECSHVIFLLIAAAVIISKSRNRESN